MLCGQLRTLSLALYEPFVCSAIVMITNYVYLCDLFRKLQSVKTAKLMFYSVLQSVKTAELMFIPRYKVLKQRN